jgi:hypothetical protein
VRSAAISPDTGAITVTVSPACRLRGWWPGAGDPDRLGHAELPGHGARELGRRRRARGLPGRPAGADVNDPIRVLTADDQRGPGRA